MGASERTATIDMGGRGGDVIYTDARGPLRFPWEMDSNGIEIPVPPAAVWEERRGPAAQRAARHTAIHRRMRAGSTRTATLDIRDRRGPLPCDSYPSLTFRYASSGRGP